MAFGLRSSVWVLLAPTASFADHLFAAPSPNASAPSNGFATAGQMTLVLALVLAAVFAVAWLMRRLRGFGRLNGQVIQVIADVSLGGNFQPGKIFTVQAVVEDPAAGQTLSLELPDGTTLIEGPATQPVASGDQPGAILWRGRVDRLGEFPFRIVSSTGGVETRTVSVSKK